MKISLQLTAWSQLKIDFLRLNYRLGQQGLSLQDAMSLLRTVDNDAQLNYPPLKLVVMLQALLAQSIIQKGCTLGLVFLDELIKQSLVVIDNKECRALQSLIVPLPLAAWQAELMSRLQVGKNQSLGKLTQSVLWENAKGQLYIDTLACAVLQQQATQSARAQFNLTLVQIRLVQQTRADWHSVAIELLEPYIKANKELSHQERRHQLLAVYHLCEIYRLRLQQAKAMLPAERQTYEMKWKQSYQLLQQSRVWRHLQAQTEARLTAKRSSMLFCFYQQTNNESNAAAERIAQAIQSNSTKAIQQPKPDKTAWLWLGLTGTATAGLSVFLWVLIKAALAMTFTLALLTPLTLATLFTLTALLLFVFTLSDCFKIVAYHWQHKKHREFQRQALAHKPTDALLQVEVVLPTYNKARRDTAQRVDSVSSSHPPADSQQAIGLGQFLRRFGLYRTKPVQIADRSSTAQSNNSVA